MSIYSSERWNEDLIRIVNLHPELNELSGKSIMITGSCGLICSAIIDLLIFYNELHTNPIIIYAASRSRESVNNRFGSYATRNYFHFIEYNADDDNFSVPDRLDYIIHGAGNADPYKIMQFPVETMTANFHGIYNLMKKVKDIKLQRLLYISSSEVYGRGSNSSEFHESEYGYIDLLNERNSYSISKRATETLCISFSKEYGIDVVIARPGHIYGPTAKKSDSRVSSAWAHNAASGETIIMKSSGQQIRSYCHCLDCATAIIYLLLFGESQSAYNIANKNSKVNIKEMALCYAKAAKTTVICANANEQERRSFNPMNNSTLNSERLYALGWQEHFTPEEGFRETITVLKEAYYENNNTLN